MNIAQARHNMIEQQIRPWDVLDERVLDLIDRMPREEFVPPEYKTLAYADINIPLAHQEVMMAPKMEARILQALTLQPTDSILEIGTGSGYLTALLARSGRQVYSLDIHADFVQQTQQKLAHHAINNVFLEIGDGANGWQPNAPYDAIVVTGSLPLFNDTFKNQLKVGGRLFVVVGQPPVMEARLITRMSEHEWVNEVLFETDLPPLVNAARPPQFVF